MSEENASETEGEGTGCPDAAYSGLEFSGTSCESSPWHQAWLAFTDREYYNRCRQIMLSYGMGVGDVEMILANCWESGWIAAKHNDKGSNSHPDKTL